MTRRRLAIDGRLDVNGPGRFSIVARADRLVVELADRRSLWRLGQAISGGRRRGAILASAAAALRGAGLGVEVTLRRRVVARLRTGTRPGWLARRLGVPDLRVRGGALALALVGPPPAVDPGAGAGTGSRGRQT